MRLPQLLLLSAAVSLPGTTALAAPRTPYEQAMIPYVAALDRQCPGRRLQDLPAGDLELVMEGFEDRIRPAQRRMIARDIRQSCAQVIAGLGCGNTSTLRTFARLHLTARFARAVCETSWRCTGPAECRQAPAD